MKHYKVALLLALTMLSACVVEEPRRGYYAQPTNHNVYYRDYHDRDYYDDDRNNWDDQDRGRGRGYHCPPGQAKKGNC